jgi:hypothetical protein
MPMFGSPGMRRCIVLAIVAVVVGCNASNAGEAAAAPDDAELRALADAIGREARDAEAQRFRCGEPAGLPTAILVATARQCMGCRDVAWLVREIQRDADHSRQALWVFTSPDDAAEVCEYLDRERSPAPVYSAGPHALSRPPGTDDLVLVEFDSAGVTRLVHAHDALLLLKAKGGGEDVAPPGEPH